MVEINAAIERLRSGNSRYMQGELIRPNQDDDRKAQLLSGQDPFAIILSCADSRVVPELIFDTGLGDLFVVRVAGNVANTSSVASIEYAVAHLNAKVIVVLAHESCGAVNAALKADNPGKNLDHLLAHITPSITDEIRSDADEVARKNAMTTANELKAVSSIIRSAAEAGKIVIKAAFYHLGTGKVDFMD